MATVQELYELWAGESGVQAELKRSLAPRGRDWLFEVFAALGPKPGQLVVDAGARDARHAIRLVREHGISASGDPQLLADFCATFQDALFAQLVDRLGAVWSRLGEPRPRELAMAGGVAANGVLRERIEAWGRERDLIVRLPEKRYCTDNAAMIAFAGLQRGADAADPRRIVARSRIR